MRLHDTLTGELKELVPAQPGLVRMYTCGPTVYNSTHIGHLRPALVGDVLARHLRTKGLRVLWVSNFTDVDDRIIARAAEQGIAPTELSGRYIDDYMQNMEALGVEIDRFARVTEHIPDIVEMIATLVDKGFAYPLEGDVYFSVESKADYGKLAGRTLGEMRAGARVAVDARKRHPMDFALWKGAKPGEPSWPSPWGPGRPGWHIECSAMSLRYLGNGFDIHGGGSDLIFPHHENEIAQSEAFTGEDPFVSIWLHNAMVEVDREKMSKSLGNFVPLTDLVARWPAGALRYFVLATHYRKPLQFSQEAIGEARRGWLRLWDARRAWTAVAGATRDGPLADRATEVSAAFDAALDDDLNTAGALGQLFELVRAGNSAVATGQTAGLGAALDVLERGGDVLGLWEGTPDQAGGDDSRAPALIDLLIELRTEARQYRDWPLADRIRRRLAELGIALEDTPDGTRWSVAEPVAVDEGTP
jgi:cysteinyl-tRNA synthetase